MFPSGFIGRKLGGWVDTIAGGCLAQPVESRDNPGQRRPADVDMLGYLGHVDMWTCWVILGSQAALPLVDKG
jgi:hypothetical protein